jgi:hypothetical protein
MPLRVAIPAALISRIIGRTLAASGWNATDVEIEKSSSVAEICGSRGARGLGNGAN